MDSTSLPDLGSAMDVFSSFPSRILSSDDRDVSINISETEAISENEEIAKVMNDDLTYIFFVVVKCAMYELFSLFGIITNSICLFVFFKIGFKDTVNVTLLGLTISDFSSLVVLFWQGICFNPLFTYSDVHFDTLSVVYLSGGWVKLYLTRVSSCITAFVTLERCLCIAMPLKVKTILTPKRAAYAIIIIFFVLGLTMPPVYYSTRLGWQWYDDRNKTLLGLVFTPDRDEIYNIVIGINLVFTYGSFFTVIACTLILVVSLDKKRQWRKSVSNNTMSAKDQSVSKMVVLIAAIFMGCFFPGTVLFIVMILVPEFNKGKAFHNLFTTVFAFSHILEAINASVNIFVYLKMSSKFKRVFADTFGCLQLMNENDSETTKN